VGRQIADAVQIGDAPQTGRPTVGVATASALGAFGETKGRRFAHCWRDLVAAHAVAHQVLVGQRKAAVVVSTVMRQLDLKAAEKLVGAT